jgi:hypothetical protein
MKIRSLEKRWASWSLMARVYPVVAAIADEDVSVAHQLVRITLKASSQAHYVGRIYQAVQYW